MATRAQNRLREALGRPARSHYGDRALPSGDCTAPPPPPACTGAGCGHSTGDPHLRTIDGLRYDFQAAGEFVAVRDTAGAYEIQVRQEPVPGSRMVAVNSAVAAKVDGDRVEARMTTAGVELLVAGVATGPAPAELASPRQLPGGGEVRTVAGGDVELRWKDGSRLVIDPIGVWGLALSVEPAQAYAGKLEGLLGDFNGKSDDDVRPRGGQPLGAQPTFAALYPGIRRQLAHRRRVVAVHLPGGQVHRQLHRPGLPGAGRGHGRAAEPGLGGGDLPRARRLRPGRAGGLRAGRGADRPARLRRRGQGGPGLRRRRGPGRADLDGAAWTPRARSRRSSSRARRGRRSSSTCPPPRCRTSAAAWTCSARTASRWPTAASSTAAGYIDGTVLPETGTYSIAVDPSGDAIGEARLRLLTVEDQREAITPDGPELTARLAKPGTVARFTFTATAGQKVFVDVPATNLPSQCGGLDLLGPDGKQVANGCVINGSGYIDGFTLPDTGTYTVVVDPQDKSVGEAKVRVSLAVDQRLDLPVDGDAVTARIAQPGAVERADLHRPDRAAGVHRGAEHGPAEPVRRPGAARPGRRRGRVRLRDQRQGRAAGGGHRAAVDRDISAHRGSERAGDRNGPGKTAHLTSEVCVTWW